MHNSNCSTTRLTQELAVKLEQGRMTINEWIIKFQTYSQAAQFDQGQLIDETTKLTQELAVKLGQGRDLRQWHSMANWEVSGKTLCDKSEDGKSPSKQDWGKPV